MSTKRPARKGNPDLRQQKHVPAPPIEEIEQEIFSLLSPGNYIAGVGELKMLFC
ncbi:hypothetical protein IQ276_025595 [Desmonostoc muscorum LEGE 12446]|uniref:Uncharacterized protein n=1 Tax=Desmonostoc muscorum LEGE 12446 TaxID=1828758 RepID=A0A8J6ZYU0_DESMC|nr:hypothetical protein [Desmonostoc muscorum]MCF2149742.1 hypothetical protein [Desmonostoc muscorum LEGE 12446]